MTVHSVEREDRIIEYLLPAEIVVADRCENAELLLKNTCGQAVVSGGGKTVLAPKGSLLLDFGREIHGGIELVTGAFAHLTYDSSKGKGISAHVTFGESVAETFTKPDYCHAVQNMDVTLVPWATVPCGELGFRFVRIENTDKHPLPLTALRARFIHRDLQCEAKFKCSDPELNKIWETSVYTLGLCMQNYFWDGIKRDRIVWMGDMYPEIKACGILFGKHKITEKSLDFVRDQTPLPEFMNGLITYSLWWILSHRLWFRYFGDAEYLKQQKDYLCELLKILMKKVDRNGKSDLGPFILLDWATDCKNGDAYPGGHALFILALRAGAELCDVLGEKTLSAKCRKTADRMIRHDLPLTASAIGNALQVLAGLRPAEEVWKKSFKKVLPKTMSTFLGCFVLDACVQAGHSAEALAILKQFWGGMLKLGATTFWEHFDIDWLKNGARIDKPVPKGKIDVHGTYGEGCYKSYRNSFCHGWASLPGEWLIRQVLGVSFVDASTIRFRPDLCGLKSASGTIPTCFGNITVELAAGKTKIKVPKGIKVIKD